MSDANPDRKLGEISNYTDSERLKSSKTDYLLKKSINLDSRFVDLQNTGLSTTLIITECFL